MIRDTSTQHQPMPRSTVPNHKRMLDIAGGVAALIGQSGYCPIASLALSGAELARR